MDIPFTYGRIVEAEDFTDRKEETGHLVSNILSLTNTAIISPRRWGKSSLVNKAIQTVNDRDILFVRINIFKCETSQDYLALLAKKVLEDTASSAELLMRNAKDFLARLQPRIMLSEAANHYELSLGVDVRNAELDDDILDLPQKIAARRNKKIVVCIDEFQQIGEFVDSARFQKILRNHWQEQKDVAYILYGSKKHMMLNIFGEYSSPFYKFGDILFLDKISNEEWIKYICKRFSDTGKGIKPSTAAYLAAQVDNHPYYVQQLAQYSWLRTEKECSEAIVDSALRGMLGSLNLQFVNLMDGLSDKQRNFLCAICDGVKNYSSVSTLEKYHLGTSGNIRIMKAALSNRDVIEVSGSKIQIQDPLFKLWIEREYLAM